jgi:hypothetical protein
LIYKLREGEKVEADNGYRGEPEKIRTPSAYYFSEEKKQKYKARARHETCNRRFKHWWGVLSQRFRHELTDHRKIFGSIVVITQIELRNGHPLFQVEYN